MAVCNYRSSVKTQCGKKGEGKACPTEECWLVLIALPHVGQPLVAGYCSPMSACACACVNNLPKQNSQESQIQCSNHYTTRPRGQAKKHAQFIPKCSLLREPAELEVISETIFAR